MDISTSLMGTAGCRERGPFYSVSTTDFDGTEQPGGSQDSIITIEEEGELLLTRSHCYAANF